MPPRQPAAVFPPGDFLCEEMAARGWTVEELAKRTGIGVQNVARVLCGEERVGVLIAWRLATALGTSAELWLNLQAAWDQQQRDG